MGEIFKLFGTIGVDNSAANKALGETESKGQSVAGKLVSSFANAAGKIVKAMTITAAGVGAALAGIALKKGWDRLIGIDDARAKLKGLGHDAESVETIMQSALESVRGTSFGMDEAATTAANAVAAGIKPGQELTKYLSTTADAAAIAGISMGEMGSIINKVQTGQKAYTENLEQLSDRGLPIYQWIAKEAGVAAGSVKDMASKGQISSELFMSAIEKNIGGAAKIIGDESFSAALKNMWASVGRIGANFLDAGNKGGGFFSQIKPLIPQVTAMFGSLEGKAADFGLIFGQVFSDAIGFVMNLGNTFNDLANSGFALNLRDAFTWIGDSVSNMVSIVSEQLPGIQQIFSQAFEKIDSILTKVGGVIRTWSVTFMDVFQFVVPIAIEIFKIAFEEIVSVVLPILESLIDMFWEISAAVSETIVNEVVPALEDFLKALQENKDLVDGLKAVVVAVGTAFLTYKGIMLGIKVAQEAYNVVMFATTLMTKGLDAATLAMAGAQGASTLAMKLNVVAVKAATVAQAALNAVMNTNIFILIATVIIALVAAFVYLWNTNEGFRNAVINIWNSIKEKAVEIFTAIGDFLSNIWETTVETVSGIITGLVDFLTGIWETIKTVAITAWNVLFAIVGGIILSFINIWKGIFEGLRIYLGMLWDGIKAVAMMVWGVIGDTIMGIVNGFVNIVMGIFNFFKTGVELIFNGIVTVASVVWNAISSVIMTVVNAVVSFVTNAFNAWLNVITVIFTTIQSVASSVWNAIKSTISSIISAAVSIATSLFNGLKNTITSIWNGIVSVVTTVVNAISNTISNVFNAIVGTVQGIFNSVKSAIEGPMNAARDLVKGVVDAIKGFFNFSISWPKIPLPHFSINPAGWQIGDLLKGKIPSLGIDWYAKGGIMTQPTAFGMNGNNLMVGGEAGAEAIAPIDTLLGYVETAVRGVMNEQKEREINVTQYITSPEPLTPREVARQTKLHLQDMATLNN